MSVQIISAKPLSGGVRLPSSKSLGHRAIIAAALTEGESILEGVSLSADIRATLEAVEALGAGVNLIRDKIHIIGKGQLKTPTGPIHCGESGSTLRFLLPLAGLLDEPLVFTGEGQLMHRPMKPYLDIFEAKGLRVAMAEGGPLMVDGRLTSGDYVLPGNVSSQFVTGLLFALPLLDGDSTISLSTDLESADYVQLSLAVLADFGVQAHFSGPRTLVVPGGQRYQARRYKVEGDMSQSAFWLVAGLIQPGEQCLVLENLPHQSLQGDARILEIIRAMGGACQWSEQGLRVHPGPTKGGLIDASQIPDLIPVLATLAAVSHGRTEIYNAARVRLKESDRLKAIATELRQLGAKIEERPDGLIIDGVAGLKGGVVSGWQDHRIVMSLAVAALKADGPVQIQGAEAVAKSYPKFFEDLKALGGDVHAQ